MSNLEKDLREQVIKSGAALGYELVDQTDEIKRAIAVFPEMAPKLSRLIVEKPYDLGFFHKKKYCAMELKKVTDAFSFVPRALLEMPHQWNGLQGIARQGGASGMLVQFKFALNEKQKQKYHIDSWLLDLTVWLPTAIMDLDHRYTLGELQESGTLIPQQGLLFDLSPIWKIPKSR